MSKQQRAHYEALKERRALVEAEEINSRYFKAEYETMYYAMEAHKIRPAYLEFLKDNHPEMYARIVETQKQEDANTEVEQREDTGV